MNDDQNLFAQIVDHSDIDSFLALSFRGMAAVLEVSEEELHTTYKDRTAIRQAFSVKGEAYLVQAISSGASGRVGLDAAILLAEAYLQFAKHKSALFNVWRSSFMMHIEERDSTAFWQMLRMTVLSTKPQMELESACLGFFSMLNGWVLMQASRDFSVRGQEPSIKALLAPRI